MTPLDDLGPDFPAVLARVRAAVEERLGALWAERLASLRRHGAEVTAMVDAARDLTLRGGKRYRAALLAAAYAGVASEAAVEPALQAGVALELLQTYLLIQDDWMDRDDTRRGGPSVHAALAARLGDVHLGAASALLASDLAWNLAFEVLASIELPPQRVVAAIGLFTRIHQDVIVGQEIDLIGRAEDVEAMHALKTGSYTVRGPLLLGASLAGAPGSTLDALERYAAPVGVAFQLRDDLLGTFGLPEETGKPVGNDLRAGKRTAVLAEAEGRLSPEARAIVDRALRHADATGAEVVEATAALDACGARAAVTDRLARLCREAEALAADLPVTPAARGWLAGAADALAPKRS
jgi:geranylgeranyl diphosphate synthase, type I